MVRINVHIVLIIFFAILSCNNKHAHVLFDTELVNEESANDENNKQTQNCIELFGVEIYFAKTNLIEYLDSNNWKNVNPIQKPLNDSINVRTDEGYLFNNTMYQSTIRNINIYFGDQDSVQSFDLYFNEGGNIVSHDSVEKLLVLKLGKPDTILKVVEESLFHYLYLWKIDCARIIYNAGGLEFETQKPILISVDKMPLSPDFRKWPGRLFYNN